MTDFLTEKRSEIEGRLKELRPLHEEYLKLERAKAALDGVDAPKRGPGRPAGSGGGTRRRRRRGGGRAQEALRVVRERPGAGVPDIAQQLGMKHRNYLYRIMSNLEGKGAVRKEGRGYVAL